MSVKSAAGLGARGPPPSSLFLLHSGNCSGSGSARSLGPALGRRAPPGAEPGLSLGSLRLWAGVGGGGRIQEEREGLSGLASMGPLEGSVA